MPSHGAPAKKRPRRDPALASLQRPVSELCCVHPECADQGLAGLGNIVVRRGKGTGRWRMLRCRACRREFSERKGTALWHSRMPPKMAIDIAKHLAEGCGIRKTARLVVGSLSIALLPWRSASRPHPFASPKSSPRPSSGSRRGLGRCSPRSDCGRQQGLPRRRDTTQCRLCPDDD